ncbi:MAG: DNA replication/repair protein RecF [Firmicutes bacterium]|nr:DNA replication/repair protein RecF [Bacillota bacterium]
MIVQRLAFSNFRNYHLAGIEPSPERNVLWGANAAGKTNALEAIVVLATGRSPRTSRDADLVRWGEQGFHVKAVLARKVGPVTLEVGYDDSAQKVVRINGAPQKTGALLGNLRVVSFFPDDVYVIKGSPALRRRLVDITLSQDNPTYYYRLIQYQKVLLQRNSLLRQWSGRVVPDDLVEPWDAQLSRIGASIMLRRAAAIAFMGREGSEVYSRISGGERLEVVYSPSVPVSGGEDVGTVSARMLEALRSSRSEDSRRGSTGTGPHRDDILVRVNGSDARLFASQGQQRTAILALKAAEMRLLEERSGESPVLLLDDVFSELDDARQASVVREMTAGVQSFITCTDPGETGGLAGGSAVFKVSDGNIEKPAPDMAPGEEGVRGT